jgi:hypothetical protein
MKKSSKEIKNLPEDAIKFANKVGHEFIFDYHVCFDFGVSQTVYKCKNCVIKCSITSDFCWQLFTNKENHIVLEKLSCKDLQIKDILE